MKGRNHHMRDFYCTAYHNDPEIRYAYNTLEEAVADIRRTILDNDELYDDEREKLLYETEYHSCYLNDIDYHIGVVIITAEDIDDCYGAELDGIHDDFIVTYDEATDTYTTT